jgi:hypothetical protein
VNGWERLFAVAVTALLMFVAVIIYLIVTGP